MKVSILTLLIVCLPLSVVAEPPKKVSQSALSAVAESLNAWDVNRATKLLNRLNREHAGHVDVQVLNARNAFLHGRYEEAVTQVTKAYAQAPSAPIRSALRLYENTRDAMKEFKEKRSPKGHFILVYKPGVDEVLIPYAGEALERAYDALGDIFNYKPLSPIRVEIYPRVEMLADVSPLKVSEIRTSGTIALCKYNRLMIVSPRALVYGYAWLDTLAHEYIHLLVTRRSRNRVPIWLHEGMAKFYENRWREKSVAKLAPVSEDLLAKAFRKKKLIRFEAMSPSMAKLPSQEDAALAFAEVFMVMSLFHEKNGEKAVNELLDKMRSGLTDRAAVAAVAGKTFKRFQREWRMYLGDKRLKKLPTYAQNRLLFRDTDQVQDELKDIPQKQARQLTYLGDRLSVRRRYKAAAKEYSKAMKKAGGPNPIVSAKLASALLRQGHHKRVPSIVGPALKLNPQHVLLYLYRGKAFIAMAKYENARNDLIQAIRLNPFDPEVHGLLAQASAKLGLTVEADRARRHQRLVTAQ